MGDIPRVGGPSNVGVQGAGPQEEKITVQKGETTLAQVAKRLGIQPKDLEDANKEIGEKQLTQGQEIRYPKDLLVGKGEKTLEQVADRMGVRKSDLESANPKLDPNNLREGQAIQLPKDFYKDAPRTKPRSKGPEPDKYSVSLPKGSGTIKKGDGAVVYEPPKIKGHDILPKIPLISGPTTPGVGGTSSTYDGDGAANTARRRQEQNNIHGTRGTDDRDLDKTTKEKLDNQKKEQGNKTTDDQIRNGSARKPNIKEEAAEVADKFKKTKEALDNEMQRRLQQNAADLVRRGGRL